jgi:hypothetical protein
MALRLDVSRYRDMMVVDAVQDRPFRMAMDKRTPPAIAARICIALWDRLVPESRAALGRACDAGYGSRARETELEGPARKGPAHLRCCPLEPGGRGGDPGRLLRRR